MIKKKKIGFYENPPKIFASIIVDGASIVRQTYNVLTGEYYPDRSLVPLTLTPLIGYNITEKGLNIENAASKLIDGHWYRFDKNTAKAQQFTSATEIINDGKTYTIDTVPGSATYGKLTTKENVDPDNPLTYVFVATLNIGEGYKVSVSFNLDSVTLAVIPEMWFDNDTQAMFNPWDERMAPKFTINPHITPTYLSATYKWQYLTEGAWLDLGTSQEHWAVQASGNGVIIDRSVMPDEIALKCIATVNVDGVNTTLEKIVTQRRRLPAFDVEITKVADIIEGTTTINPEALIQTGHKVVTDPGEEVTVNWYGSSSSPIASGMQVSLPVSSLGSAMDISLEVVDNGGYKALIDDDGEYLVDDDGEQIILK